MGIHDGPELNRPYFEFTVDPDREPFPIARYKVSDEDYAGYEIWSDGSVRTSDGATVAAAITVLTDNTSGTANGTLQALSDGSTYANDVAAIRNNFADLAAKVNEIINALGA